MTAYRRVYNNKKKKKKIYNMHIVKHKTWIGGAGSRQVAGRSMLIVNELGYEVRLEVVLEAV